MTQASRPHENRFNKARTGVIRRERVEPKADDLQRHALSSEKTRIARMTLWYEPQNLTLDLNMPM